MVYGCHSYTSCIRPKKLWIHRKEHLVKVNYGVCIRVKSEDLQIKKVVVSEAGASVYSASELAAKEYPDLDLTVRGAISVAHRLQDPLAESSNVCKTEFLL